MSRGAVVLALLASGLYVVALIASLWRRGGGRLSAGRLVVLLTLVSLVVHLAGIEFELLDHPRNDEGVYYQEALRINQGQALPKTFNYGHVYYYLPAVVLWIEELFAAPIGWLAGTLYGLESPLAVRLLLLRALSALLGALTTIPVFWAAHRIAGPLAATVGGLLITFSTDYNAVAHEVISDVPSGFFAAVCFGITARLLDGETYRDYVLAGIAAGLAAGSKYPGGVAAVAIFGMWLSWRMRARAWSWHLFAAAGASILTMLAVMPALWLQPEAVATGSGRDIFFGWRQYALSGWTGVTPDSIPGYYWGRLVGDLGAPALLLGLAGLFVLAARERRRLVAMSLFPVAYLVLIGSMSMAVVRNLQPVLPAVAAVLGVGCSAWYALAARHRPRWGRATALAVCALAVAGPMTRTVAWDISHSRPGTRQLMRDWIETNLPHGTGILREDYTPELDRRHYLWLHRRFAWRFPQELLKSREWDYVMVADAAYGRFFPEKAAPDDHRLAVAKLYEEIFAWPLAAEFRPSRFRTGPRVSLYRLPATDAEVRTERRWSAAEVAWVSDEAIRPAEESGPLRFNRRWQIAVFKEFFAPGRYEIELVTEPPRPEAYVHVVTPDNLEVGAFEAADLVVELPRRDKYLVRVFQEPGSTLSALAIRPAPEGVAPSEPLPPG